MCSDAVFLKKKKKKKTMTKIFSNTMQEVNFNTHVYMCAWQDIDKQCHD